MSGHKQVFPDLEQLSHAAASALVELANRQIEKRGYFNMALAGGGTPKRLYEYLATEEFRDKVDWSRVGIYFGDERNVPQDDPDSNYRMAHLAFLDKLAIPKDNIHPFDTRLEVRRAAAAYARLLALGLPKTDSLPRFDLVLLGMGEDGHTASLFPTTCILHDDRLAASVYVEKLRSWRLSLTYPVINNAEHVWLLVAGKNKAKVLSRLQQPDAGQFPVNGVRPRGELSWYLDEASASEL